MGCKCGESSNTVIYVVTYPAESGKGQKEVNSEVAARAEMSKFPGATWRRKA